MEIRPEPENESDGLATGTLPIATNPAAKPPTLLERLADILEEEIWLPSKRARALAAPTSSTYSISW